MISHHIPEAICPVCNKKADGATCTDPDNELGPQSGDVAICVECQAINIYTEESTLRPPTVEELEQLPMVEIIKAQKILKEFHIENPNYRKLH